MKHPFLLWLALLFSLMTATSHATHLKGGSLSWERITTEPGFKVRAKVTLNFDLTTTIIKPTNWQTTPKVNGVWVYEEDMPVSSDGSGCWINWGDGSSSLPLSQFKVESVDYAAQIVTVVPTEESLIQHPYTANATYTMALLGEVRDDEEELMNRQDSTMRVESTVLVNTTTPSANRPPVFNAAAALLIVDKSNPTFQAPVAADPDGDTVKYSFHLLEKHATVTNDEEEPSWESVELLAITDGGEITWSKVEDIAQTVHTYAIQVVATDYDSNDDPKSSSVIEFQAWVNDPDQDGVPEIELAPSFETFTAYPGQLFQFRILGTDLNSEEEVENSRLEAVIPSGDMPPGAVLVPSGGFAGVGSGLPSHGGHGSRMEAVFSWTPTGGQANTQWTLHIKVEDDDGHLSTEKVVTINVGSPTTQPPLQMSVTGGTEGVDEQGLPVIKVVGRPGDDLAFTVTGSTAITGADLQIFSFDHLPHGSVMDPELPATGTNGSVQSVFTWEDLTEEDFTSASDPHEVTFHVADEFGREVSRKVYIYVFPVLPTIELAAGETTPVTKETWKSTSFRYVVTGHGNLDISPRVGTVDDTYVTAPHTGTFAWRALPGQLTGDAIEVTVSDSYGQTDTLSVPVSVAPTTIPAWWTTRGVLTGGDADDYAVATQGQLKAIASKAYAEMLAADSSLPTLEPEGAALAAYISGFSSEEGNYNPLLQGQLKHGAKLFYQVIAKKTGKALGLPWTEEEADDDRHYAPANLGQVKALFSFPLPLSTLFNDPPLVTLVTPIHGQSYTAAATPPAVATIQLTATASDPDGSIASVTFYNGTTVLHTDSTSPYDYSWSSVPVGSYNITAKATDNRGAETTTSTATVSVVAWTDPAPVVAITSPTANQSFPNPAQITINATATDNGTISQVSFYAGGTWIGNDSSAPYSVTWSNVTAGGTHQLVAYTWDNLGQFASSSTVNITVAAPVPNVTNLTLRNGYNGYNGMVDTYIRSDYQGKNYSLATPLRLDRGPDASALLRWDLSQIPANVNVTGVKLILHIGNDSTQSYEIYALRRSWSPAGANWKQSSNNKPWGIPGAKDVNADRENVVLGTIFQAEHTGDATAVPLNQDGVNKVKQWIADPSTNHGFIIQDYSGSNARPLYIVSGDEEYASFRPALQIFYE